MLFSCTCLCLCQLIPWHSSETPENLLVTFYRNRSGSTSEWLVTRAVMYWLFGSFVSLHYFTLSQLLYLKWVQMKKSCGILLFFLLCVFTDVCFRLTFGVKLMGVMGWSTMSRLTSSSLYLEHILQVFIPISSRINWFFNCLHQFLDISDKFHLEIKLHLHALFLLTVYLTQMFGFWSVM